MKKYIVIFILFLSCSVANSATYYVDSAVSSSGDGKTWTTAWKAFSNITGLVAGDIVYVSGGSSGSSKNYSITSIAPTSGVAGNPITYKIGQTTGHNGTANFTLSSGTAFLTRSHVVISGDAGDGGRHFSFTGSYRFVDNISVQNVRISYINYTSIKTFFYGIELSEIEVDHCSINHIVPQSDNSNDQLFYFQQKYGSWTYDNSKLHHNIFYVPFKTGANGIGGDGLVISGRGVSIYENYFIGTGYSSASYGTSTQHHDGMQTNLTQYFKIYNNTFIDFVNYPIFLQLGSTFSHTGLQVYNNIMYMRSVVSTGVSMGIVLSSHFANEKYTDVVIANNLIADIGSRPCIYWEDDENQPIGNFTNCQLRNNICLGGTGFSIDGRGVISESGNVTISTANAPSSFVTYSQYGGDSNNYHLKSGASSLIGQGYALNTIFTLDKDGLTRGATWDIGPYEYSGAAPPADTTPPIVTQQSPTGTISCTIDPMTITEIASTNEAATLKWNATNVAYDSMTGAWSTTGGTSHNKSVSRPCGAAYSFYMAGMDVAGNKSTPIAFSYTISAAIPDPIVFITGTRFGLNNSAHVQGTTLDLYNSVSNPDLAFSTAQSGFLRTLPADTAGRVIYFKTDLSTIPTNAVVSASKLYMYQNEGDGDETLNISIHQITGTAFTGTSTWATYAYADNIAAAESTEDAGSTSGWREWDIATMAAAWVADPTANKGLALLTDQGATHATEDTFRGFALSDNTDATTRPFIVVAYTIPAPDDKVMKGSGTLTITPGGSGTLTFKFKPE